MRSTVKNMITALIFCILLGTTAWAQATEFTYQGNLKDGANTASGSYDFEFLLFDSLNGGTQQGSTLTRNSVAVAGGTFAVSLDFGSQFPGANRFLEIHVRPAGGGAFTPLSPRQPVASSPYAVQSLNATSADTATNATNAATATNATQLGGVAANQYVLTGDARLTDARPPTAGSTNYIQNGTSTQASSNFNVSGNGIAGGILSGGTVNAATQFNLGGNRVLSKAGTNNLFAGDGAGQANTTGSNNSFFGPSAGFSNTTGFTNAFFGRSAGFSNTTGQDNSFFGPFAGLLNTTGSGNAFFGLSAGAVNTTGFGNAFFGGSAGISNTTGSGNAFFGSSAGSFNTTGINNSFFGAKSGQSNTTGTDNAFFGSLAGNDTTSGFNTFVGSSAGKFNTNGTINSFFGANAGLGNTTGIENSFFGAATGNSSGTGSKNTLIGYQADSVSSLNNATAIGANAIVAQSNSLVLGSINGINSATADTNVGIGTTAPAKHLHIRGSGDQEIMIESSDAGGIKWTLQSSDGAAGGRFEIVDRTSGASRFSILSDGSVGVGTVGPTDKLDVNGTLRVRSLGVATATSVCRTATNQIAACTSSIKYKTNVLPFEQGLNLIKRLRPVRFNWISDKSLDLGLVAEEVEAVEPLLVTYDPKSEVEGVKYDRVGVVLINAVKEQQTEIEALEKKDQSQQAQIAAQQRQIDELRKTVCSLKPSADGCKQEEK